MIETGRRSNGVGHGQPRFEFVQADALNLPFENAFDLAVCFGAIGHILPKDQRRFVTEVAQVLKPGGRFVFATSEMPPWTSRRYWLSRGFNAAMHLRNSVLRPPFVMFYLTLLIPEAVQLFEHGGFHVEVIRDVFPPPFHQACLIKATLTS